MRERKWKSRLILQVHDALTMDIYPPEFEEVMAMVEQVTTVDLPKAWDWIIVPLQISKEVAGIDEPWSALKKWKG